MFPNSEPFKARLGCLHLSMPCGIQALPKCLYYTCMVLGMTEKLLLQPEQSATRGVGTHILFLQQVLILNMVLRTEWETEEQWGPHRNTHTKTKTQIITKKHQLSQNSFMCHSGGFLWQTWRYRGWASTVPHPSISQRTYCTGGFFLCGCKQMRGNVNHWGVTTPKIPAEEG